MKIFSIREKLAYVCFFLAEVLYLLATMEQLIIQQHI